MKLAFFACAQSVIVDASSNSMSIINVLEDQISEGFPLLIPQLTVASVMRREDGDPDIMEGKLELYFDKERVVDLDVKFDLANTIGARSIAQIQQVIIPHPTNLRIILSVAGKRLASWETRFDGKPQIKRQPAPNVGAPPRKPRARKPAAAVKQAG